MLPCPEMCSLFPGTYLQCNPLFTRVCSRSFARSPAFLHYNLLLVRNPSSLNWTASLLDNSNQGFSRQLCRISLPCTPPTANFLMDRWSLREKKVHVHLESRTICVLGGGYWKMRYLGTATWDFQGNSWLEFTATLPWHFALLVSIELLKVNDQIRVGKYMGASPAIDFWAGYPSEINGELCLKTSGMVRATFLKQKEAQIQYEFIYQLCLQNLTFLSSQSHFPAVQSK